jgi:phosphoglycerate dehydrogenase-like enzyme
MLATACRQHQLLLLLLLLLLFLLQSPAAAAGIINAQLLSWLRHGSAVINGGRGKHLVEADLLAALDSGQVRCFRLPYAI